MLGLPEGARAGFAPKGAAALMQLVRHNHITEIDGAPSWFYEYLSRILSVPVELGTQPGKRFGITWWWEGQVYGSLLRGRTVAAGLTPHVESLAAHYGLPCRTSDVRQRPEDSVPWWCAMAKARPYQERVHRKLLQHSVGVVDAPPRSGKTLMTARIIDSIAAPTVVVAPSVQIVRQTYERYVAIFGEDLVARLDGSAKPQQRDASKPVVVATAISASRMSQEWWDARDMLIIDEFHHAAAETYHRINLLAKNVYYRYGFTGTHFRSGDDRLAMEAVCSFVLERIPLSELVPEFVAPAHVFFARVRSGGISAGDWLSAYKKGICELPERNEMVRQIVQTMLENGIPTLVLTRHRQHADDLGDLIDDAVVVKGGAGALTSRAVQSFVEGRVDCLVGTTVIGEGVDVPRAGALVYASGGRGGVGCAQSYFRPMTAHAGKTCGRIYDFIDSHHGVLSRHSDSRIITARDLFGASHVIGG